jgi:hypothetical protein
MADGEDAEKGLSGARTRAESAGSDGGSASLADRLAADIARMAGELGEDGDQLDLLAGSPDQDAVDTLAMAAETATTGRRERGRPAGSANRRNTAVFDYLEALGHRCPAVTLSLYQSADVADLARALHCDRVDAAKLQVNAAAQLIQYKFAKKKELDIRSRELHVFLAGQLGDGVDAGGDGGLSIFGGQIEGNQGLSEGASVRQTVDVSHDEAKPLASHVKQPPDR